MWNKLLICFGLRKQPEELYSYTFSSGLKVDNCTLSMAKALAFSDRAIRLSKAGRYYEEYILSEEETHHRIRKQEFPL